MTPAADYYEAELQYLYESGRRFAAAHPDTARLLNIDTIGDRDPTVERLFEGFAFLTARIREKIDDLFPEITETLVERLWPQLLQAIPSAAIVELTPRRGWLQRTHELPRGLEVLSSQVGPERTRCRFTTTQPIRMHPLSLTGVQSTIDTGNRQALSFTFRLENGIDGENLSLSPLRLYLHAELAHALILHEFLTTRITSVELADSSGHCAAMPPPHQVITPGGLNPEESLLPQPVTGTWGYSLLAEYFAFPEKFLFVDIHGLDSLGHTLPLPSAFMLTLTFDRALPPGITATRDMFRLFCTPVVNLYQHDAEPIRLDRRTHEYRIIADCARPNCVHAHSVVSVVGIDRSSGVRTVYPAAAAHLAQPGTATATYTLRRDHSSSGLGELSLSLGGPQLRDGSIREENVTVGLYCSNGTLPREELSEGDIDLAGREVPDFVSLRNITRPTLPCAPPTHNQLHWAFLTHLSAGYTSLSSADTLRALLDTYNWSRSSTTRRRIESITDVSLEPCTRVAHGTLVRGVRLTVTIQQDPVGHDGDLCVFGEVLRGFLAHTISLNTVLELHFLLSPSGTRLPIHSIGGRGCPI